MKEIKEQKIDKSTIEVHTFKRRWRIVWFFAAF